MEYQELQLLDVVDADADADLPPPPPPLDADVDAAEPAPEETPPPPATGLLAALQRKRSEILGVASSAVTSSAVTSSATSSGRWLQELQAKQATLQKKASQHQLPPVEEVRTCFNIFSVLPDFIGFYETFKSFQRFCFVSFISVCTRIFHQH